MSKKITIFHIDDELAYINKTKKIIYKIPQCEYLGFSTDPVKGVKELLELKPDILLLDIDMPVKNGFWVAEQLKNRGTHIVFVTSFAGYAVDAFKCFALHYLIKPIGVAEVEQVIERFNSLRLELLSNQSEQISELLKGLSETDQFPRRIFVNTQKQILILQLDEVVYISAEGSYTNFHLADGKIIVSGKNMKNYSSVVEKNPDFIKVHRSYIVNQSHLTSIDKKKMNLSFIFKNGAKIQMATFRRDKWMEKFM